jgi:hypothetical protein
MGMMISLCPSLLGSIVAIGKMSSHPLLLCFSDFNELAKSLI